MSLGNTFFIDQKEWSKRKLEIISSYLDGFTKILSSTFQSCVYYVDGFAGKGIYDDDSKGSPVLATELSFRYREQQKKYTLNCINVEENKDNFDFLEIATQKHKNYVENLFGSFSNNVPIILKKIDNCPALFFIDPFGVKGTKWVDMEKIINRSSPTDLWLRFDHKTVRRLSGFFESGSFGADGKVKRLLELYGETNSDFLKKKLDGFSTEERIENAVNYYIEKVEKEFKRANKYNFGFSAAFPIISLEGENKYYLVFAASHPKAVILASETVYSVEKNRPEEIKNYLENKTRQPYLLLLDPTECERSQYIEEKLKDDIWKLCEGKILKRQQIYLLLLNFDKKKWFGNFSSANLNHALKAMEIENIPRIIQRSGPVSDDKSNFTFNS